MILRVEYSRIDNRTTARTEVVALTATIVLANLTGLTKLGSMLGGGAIDGIIFALRPGGNDEAILRDWAVFLSLDGETRAMNQRKRKKKYGLGFGFLFVGFRG